MLRAERRVPFRISPWFIDRCRVDWDACARILPGLHRFLRLWQSYFRRKRLVWSRPCARFAAGWIRTRSDRLLCFEWGKSRRDSSTCLALSVRLNPFHSTAGSILRNIDRSIRFSGFASLRSSCWTILIQHLLWSPRILGIYPNCWTLFAAVQELMPILTSRIVADTIAVLDLLALELEKYYNWWRTHAIEAYRSTKVPSTSIGKAFVDLSFECRFDWITNPIYSIHIEIKNCPAVY